MKPNLRALSKVAANVLYALLLIISLVPVIGCGDSAQDGVEDTGSVLHVSAVAADEGGRNVDVAPDDLNNDGVLDGTDNLLTDTSVTITFTNTSLVPDLVNATTLTVTSYTIDYSTSDPTAPLLSSRTFLASFVIEPDQVVERADILLVVLATVDEFNAGPFPTEFPTEYIAHYTFHVENDFGETQTAKASVAFSFGDFLPSGD